MSAAYRAVQWNAHKRLYDAALVAGVALYLAVFIAGGVLLFPAPNDISPPILLMCALGTLAIVLLHLILIIGPLARLDPRFAVLLYNRRHLGVTFFLIALAHAALATLFYGGFGDRPPILAVLDYPASPRALGAFPFEITGFAALIVFFLMAATSHDFWLTNLSPRWWKTLHMLVYPAYALVVLHVALGSLQSQDSAIPGALLGAGVALVSSLHIAAALRQRRTDRAAAQHAASTDDHWIDLGPALDIPDTRARIVCPAGGPSIAVFRRGDAISAISNVCAHQGGPLGEGQIIDGCATCPWHGYQYRPEDGRSPPPYTERLATFRVRITAGRAQVHPEPLPPGTPVPPARLDGSAAP